MSVNNPDSYSHTTRRSLSHLQSPGQRQCHGWGCHLGVLSPEHAYSSGVRVSGSDGLDGVDHDCRSRECHDRIPRGERVWYFPRTDQHASNRRNRHSPGHSARGATRNTAPPFVGSKRMGTRNEHLKVSIICFALGPLTSPSRFVPPPTKRQRIGDEIKAAPILSRSH